MPDVCTLTVRLAFNPATPVQTVLMGERRTTRAVKHSPTAAPAVRLAVGSMHERAHRRALTTDRLPALLVSYVYLQPFLKNRHRYRFRDWVMDSGAFSAANSGRVITLDEYVKTCHHLIATDPSLVEIFALDVIGDPQASAANCDAMWKEGIPAIPCFHYGEPEGALMAMAERYPKIAIGGVAYKRGTAKTNWARQVFARVWPKRIHGFAFGGEDHVMALPFHSVDSSSWEIGACGFGNWKQFGHLVVRGSDQDLRGEVQAYLELEDRARVKWAPQMRELDALGSPDVRLAFARSRTGTTDKLAKLAAPAVRLAVVKALGRGELMAT
jgi:hypothetical protein